MEKAKSRGGITVVKNRLFGLGAFLSIAFAVQGGDVRFLTTAYAADNSAEVDPVATSETETESLAVAMGEEALRYVAYDVFEADLRSRKATYYSRSLSSRAEKPIIAPEE